MKTASLIATMLLLLTACAVAQEKKTATTKPASAASSQDLAEEWIAAWNSHDVEKVAALFTDDVMYEDVAFAQITHGAADLRKFVASEWEAVPDLKVELVESSIQGEHGSIEWIFSGTDKSMFNTGKKFSVRGVSIITVKNGRISRNQDFYDVATLMRQLGLLPENK